MFCEPIGRVRYFIYSLLLVGVTAIAILVCFEETMGIMTFLESKPGIGREQVALAVFSIASFMLVLQANITWRRGKDADISKWVLVPYIAMLFASICLQSLTVLIYDVGGDNSNFGLSIVNLAILGWWIHILFAPSRQTVAAAVRLPLQPAYWRP